jgi:hypothetical protein
MPAVCFRQRLRKRIEEDFGRMKTMGGLRKFLFTAAV